MDARQGQGVRKVLFDAQRSIYLPKKEAQHHCPCMREQINRLHRKSSQSV